MDAQVRERLQAEALALLASAKGGGGDDFDFGRRMGEVARALEIFRGLGHRSDEARALIRMGSLARNAADFPAALEYFHEAESIAEALADPVLQRDVSGQLMIILIDVGDHDAALALVDREWEAVRESGDAEARMIALNGAGCVRVAMGRAEEGVAQLLRSHELVDAIPDEARRGHMRAQSLADLAEGHLAWGRPKEALSHAEQAIASAQAIGFSPLVMLASMYAGQAALALERLDLAEARLRETVAMARRMNLRSQQATASLALGEALSKLGRHQDAFASYRSGHEIEKDIRLHHAARSLEFRRAQRQVEAARREREQAERVLFTVLPRPIAERMTRGESRIAEEIPDASVLFADLVGFTALSTRTAPRDLLEVLDGMFSEFDRLTAVHGLEKVKTIGDAYMAVGGALARSDRHLEDAARLAIGLVRAVDRMGAASGTLLAIRIGLHAGPVIAGVIGSSRLSYDFWGETVNLASRLESSGTPGRINVSGEVARRLEGRFALEPRGSLELKGFGLVPAYYLS